MSPARVSGRRKRIMERKGEEVRQTRNNALGVAVGDCHGLAFLIGPRLQKSSLCVAKPSLVWGAGPHGASRVSTGVSSRRFPLLETAVFSRFSARFCAEKVLRRLAQTNLLESNVRLPEIRIHIPTTGRWKLESQNPTSKFAHLEFGLQLPISKS